MANKFGPGRKIPEIAEAPSVVGKAGVAWDFEIPEEGRGGAVHAWRIRAPWAHPLWWDYVLFLVHLRELPRMQPAKIYVPGATHEFLLYALDPDGKNDLTLPPTILKPCNFAAQLIKEDDEAAERECLAAVQEICNGTLSPDTDFLAQWVARYGDAMIRK